MTFELSDKYRHKIKSAKAIIGRTPYRLGPSAIPDVAAQLLQALG